MCLFMCMYVCIYVIWIYTLRHVLANIHESVYIYISVCIYPYMYMADIHTYIINMNAYLCMYVCIYV